MLLTKVKLEPEDEDVDEPHLKTMKKKMMRVKNHRALPDYQNQFNGAGYRLCSRQNRDLFS